MQLFRIFLVNIFLISSLFIQIDQSLLFPKAILSIFRKYMFLLPIISLPRLPFSLRSAIPSLNLNFNFKFCSKQLCNWLWLYVVPPSLKFQPLKFSSFFYLFRIKFLIFTLIIFYYNIDFLWIPRYIGLHGNEIVDNLVKSTSYLIYPPLTQFPHTDFIPFIKRYISNLWSSHWMNQTSPRDIDLHPISWKQLGLTDLTYIDHK